MPHLRQMRNGPIASPEAALPKSPPPSPPSIDRGVAGASAQREMERRSAKREERIRRRFGRFGGLVLAVTDDPQTTRSWGTGAEGERKLGSLLAKWFAEDEEAIVLHDRRVPRSRANVDHIVIAPAGVFVVDAKKYQGKVAKRDVGGFFKKDERLFVGRRDCSRLVEGMKGQVDLVESVLASDEVLVDCPVVGVLCFVDAEWSLFAKPFQIEGVSIMWPKALRSRVTAEPRLDATQRALAAGVLSNALPPA